MARKKKEISKKKSFVRIREKKLANGRIRLYLDIYKDGKRSYEFLDKYLYPETSEEITKLNLTTRNEAEQIALVRNNELLLENSPAIKASTRSKMLLADWLKIYGNKKLKNGQSDSRSQSVQSLTKHLIAYKGDKVVMSDVDKKFCLGFIQYLKTAKTSRGAMHPNTAKFYLNVLTCALNDAVRNEVIPSNPIQSIGADEKIKGDKSSRCYLDIEEVQALIKTECVNEQIKSAFLFSCFCGLRFGDVRNLKWSDIRKTENGYRLNIVMQKTRDIKTDDLSDEALHWLPDRGNAKDGDNIFTLPSLAYVELTLKSWALAAGIKKNVTFHVARHTFATMMLTLGADIYTTSKLLGHKDIKVTQIYAEIVDKKKHEAVNLVNGIFK